VIRNGWFRYCRPRGETDLIEQIDILEAKRQFVEEIIANIKRLLAAHGSAQ
jgi:hypothetical protein